MAIDRRFALLKHTHPELSDLIDALEARLAATTSGDGASMIGVEDSAGNFIAADVEAALAELAAASGGGGGGATFSGANIYRSSNLTVFNASTDRIAFNAEAVDEGGWVDLGTNDTQFVVPSGVTLVQIKAQARFEAGATSGHMELRLDKNGIGWDVICLTDPNTASGVDTTLFLDSGPQPTEAGDLWGVRIRQESGGPLDLLSTGTWMTIERLG